MCVQLMQVPMRMVIVSTMAADFLEPGYIRSSMFWVMQLVQPFSQPL